MEKSHLIRTAGIIALTGNLILAAVKIFIGIFYNSLAVLGDGIDSSTDVLIAIVTLIVSAVISRPSDSEHPWGHGRAETTATMILTFIIFLAGSQLTISSFQKIIAHDFQSQTQPAALIAAAVSMTGKAILSLILYKIADKANSSMTRANAANMRNDIMISMGVFAGLIASKLFSMPVLDPLTALIVGLLVIKSAVEMFIDLNRELMDGNKDRELYEKLFKAAVSVNGVSNPHRARIRKIASLFDIDLDIEVAPDITVFEAHEKAEQVEDAIRKAIPDVYDVVIHIEPQGSEAHQRKEEYGLSPQELHSTPGI